MTGSAHIEGPYRYRLTRELEGGGDARVVFVMLNPSTADATQDDPTIRRCISFARKLGASVLEVVNLFALRSPRPADLLHHDDPIGPRNDDEIRAACENATWIVAAWGGHRAALLGRRADTVLGRLERYDDRLLVLGLTKGGEPRHPLFMRGDVVPVRWRGGNPVDVPRRAEGKG